MSTFAVVDTINDVPSGPCPVASTMAVNMSDQGHVYVASNTSEGTVRVLDAGTNSVVAVLGVGARPTGVGIRMWPMHMQD